jgi:hypothetical protein
MTLQCAVVGCAAAHASAWAFQKPSLAMLLCENHYQVVLASFGGLRDQADQRTEIGEVRQRLGDVEVVLCEIGACIEVWKKK